MENNNKQWGFLRETKEAAEKAGIDKDTGVCRTGLDEYLEILFPGSEWIHDLPFGNHGDKNYRIRPDYRCEKLKLIVEFDGIQHYQKPDVIRRDIENQKVYESYGYSVVRIPYFIQLTNEVVKSLFGVDVAQPLFPESIPSMGPKGLNTPAYCCHAGVIRMAEELLRFPQQLEVNMDALKKMDDEMLSGANLLENIVAEKQKEKRSHIDLRSSVQGPE